MSSADFAGAGYDVERGLHELIARGYQFVHPTDERGEVQAVVGVRVHDEVIDVVRLNAEDDVEATRLPVGEQNIFAPEAWLWRSQGEAPRVLAEVLALPDDSVPDGRLAAAGDNTPARKLAVAHSAAQGCWVPGRGGRSKWLAAR
ncbi:hypothetical protein [Amycolatopsis jiangsuensis]|uniref:Uncharacterized protein n=1 Tax=Amycolatopsis jiangsuensis TaxID=1181879 RepID=A0A840J1M4_9PSEU|nr:hypothetical protein [Amycolatopsis jiangsuensis]MBB4687545.1 hypothetical protein [Amycolatopsis jiangsuensis]